MTKKQKLLSGAGFSILLALAIIWFVRAPYSTLQSIKGAAERRDVPELNRLIDFPSVKSSLKLLVMGSVNGNTGEPASLRKGLAHMFAGALAGPLIEAMVTPESIAAMFGGKLPRKPGAAPQPAAPQGPDSAAATGSQDVTVTRDWDGLSAVRVNVRSNAAPDQGLTFVMRRDGLSWRLSAIER